MFLPARRPPLCASIPAGPFIHPSLSHPAGLQRGLQPWYRHLWRCGHKSGYLAGLKSPQTGNIYVYVFGQPMARPQSKPDQTGPDPSLWMPCPNAVCLFVCHAMPDACRCQLPCLGSHPVRHPRPTFLGVEVLAKCLQENTTLQHLDLPNPEPSIQPLLGFWSRPLSRSLVC